MQKTLKRKYIETRPWGQFEQFTQSEPSTVKILTINPNQAISLQYHNHRSEFWKVISGKGKITVGDNIYSAKTGDEFFIAQRQNHRIQTNTSLMKVLEISFGKFAEDDIVRLEDKYSRSE